MTRALSLTCLSLLMLGSVAVAGNKPKIAVLGVEVVGAEVTAQDTQVAKELTEALRGRAKAGTGPFEMAPGSDKELIDEKLMKSCDSEAPACMSSIGTDLGADWLIYGKIEKQGASYRVDLKLLNVTRKAMEKTWPENIPVSQASGSGIQGWAKKGYAKLTGQNNVGTVVVKVGNADRGTVLIDGTEKGNIVNGKASIDLPPGKYRLQIESQGFQRWEKDITVTEDQQTSVPAELEKPGVVAPPPMLCDPAKSVCENVVSHPSGNSTWKGVFYASVAVAAVSGGLWIYGYSQIGSIETRVCNAGGYNMSPDHPGCGARVAGNTDDVASLNSKGDGYHNMTVYGGIGTGVFGIFAVYALYKGFIAQSGEDGKEHAALGHRVRRDRFVVTPIASPTGGGAMLRFDW
ncbi:MAG: hypothetical protein JWO36_6221 [Myxococcales bacterium]|nr:hypothetical protein [Myxococcales bacterium]